MRRGGELIELTATEFELLRFLMRNPRRVLSKAQILDRVWNYDFGGQAHVVELYISYLRKKIDAGREPMIHTVRGVGYVLKPTAMMLRCQHWLAGRDAARPAASPGWSRCSRYPARLVGATVYAGAAQLPVQPAHRPAAAGELAVYRLRRSPRRPAAARRAGTRRRPFRTFSGSPGPSAPTRQPDRPASRAATFTAPLAPTPRYASLVTRRRRRHADSGRPDRAWRLPRPTTAGHRAHSIGPRRLPAARRSGPTTAVLVTGLPLRSGRDDAAPAGARRDRRLRGSRCCWPG